MKQETPETDENLLLLGTLSKDWSKQASAVELHPDFFEVHPIQQLDTLLDWVEILQVTYNDVLKAYERKH